MAVTRERAISLEELDSGFSEAVIKAGGERSCVCFQCGTCAASCPIIKFNESYNPRLIVRSAVLGLAKRLLFNNMIWLCAACYSCTERCPRGVRPTEVIRAIRNIAVRRGHIHPAFRLQADTVINHGRIWEDEEFINEIREDMELPPISPVNLDEITKILEHTGLKGLLRVEKGES